MPCPALPCQLIAGPANAAFFIDSQPDMNGRRAGAFVQARTALDGWAVEAGLRIDRTRQSAGLPQLGAAVPAMPRMLAAAYAASDSLPGVPHGTGVAMLGWWMRLGFLLTSPAVGTIGDTLGLRAGLAILVVAGLTAAVIAHRPASNGAH